MTVEKNNMFYTLNPNQEKTTQFSFCEKHNNLVELNESVWLYLSQIMPRHNEYE